MRISVKTAGLLNAAVIEVPAGATPIDVIRQLGMPADGQYLVIHNGATVPKAQRASVTLAEDDTLAIVPPLKGG
jgi:sulfur carrier protein ThiS